MSRHAFSRAVLVVFSLISAGWFTVTVEAQTIWNGQSASSSAGTGSNWVGEIAPAGLGTDDVVFGVISSGPQVGATAQTVRIPSLLGLHDLSFTGGSARPAYTFTDNDGSTLTLTGSITAGSGADIVFQNTVPIKLSAGSRTVTVNGTNVKVFGAIGEVSDSASVQKEGTGSLLLGGANTFRGGLTVNAGTLYLATDSNIDGEVIYSSPVGTGTLKLKNDTTLSIVEGYDISNIYLLNPISLDSTAGTAAIGLASGLELNLSGIISGTAGGLTKSGLGTLSLSGENTFQGDLYVQAGTVQVNSNTGTGLGALEFGSSNNGLVKFNSSSPTIYGLEGGSTATIRLNHESTGGTTLTINQSANTEFVGTIEEGISSSIVKAGSGTLKLSGTSTYTGTTTVNAGTLQFGKRTALYSNDNENWIATNLVVAAGATAAFNVGGTGEFTSSDLDILKALGAANGGFKSGSNLGLDTTNAGGNFTYGSAIANPNGGANVLGLTKLGTGTLTLTGANTYTGTTTISAGTLSLGIADALPIVTGLTLAPSTTLDVANNQTVASLFSNTPSSSVVIANGKSFTVSGSASTNYLGLVSGGGALVKAGSGTLNLTGNATHTGGTTISAGTLSIGDGGNTGSIAGNVLNNGNLAFNRFDSVTFAGVVSDTGSLTKTGAGNLTLTGSSTYAGNTTVSAGTLTVGAANALPGTTLLSLASGSTLAVNFNQTIAGFFDASGAGAFLQLATGTTFTVAMPVANTSTTFAGSVNGAGTFAVSGAGNDIVNLTGSVANTITTQIGPGATLSIGSGGSLNGPITTTGTLSFSNAGSQTLNGVISGSGGLLASAGTTTLTAANLYTGPTSITGGRLLVANTTGSGTGTGTVTVASGGTFGGTGFISGPLVLNSGGIVSPGASPGTLSVGATTFDGGGRFAFEINNTAGTPGTNWDLLSISGTLTINATPANPFLLDLTSLTTGNAAGPLTGFDNTSTYSWQFVSATGVITGFSAGAFQYNASQFQNSLGAGHFFVSQSGNTLSLTFTPVPEPSTYALLVLGLGFVIVTLRRRKA